MPEQRWNRLTQIALVLVRETRDTSFTLFRIIIPVMILTKILQEVGAVEALGRMLAPLMELLGLPGSMALVWAAAMVTNLYGGMAAFAQLAPEAHLTAAQATVLTTMMLVAHALPVELRVAQKAGPRLRFMGLFRFIGALVIGGLLNLIYTRTGMLQQANVALWTPAPEQASWWGWAIDQVRILAMMFLIILLLLTLLKTLKYLGVTEWLTRRLSPLLRAMGMGREAAPLTIIGMTMGIAYGGGLIIAEARAGHLKSRDIFFSLALLGLCHSLIEDTLLMISLGGHVSGVLFGRAIFAVGVVFLLVKALAAVPDPVFNRFFFRPQPQTRPEVSSEGK